MVEYNRTYGDREWDLRGDFSFAVIFFVFFVLRYNNIDIFRIGESGAMSRYSVSFRRNLVEFKGCG